MGERGSIRRWALPAAAMLAIAVCVVGCDGDGGRSKLTSSPAPVAEIDRIEMLSLPAAVNLDNKPGPDGLRVQTYLFQVGRPQPVPVSGTLEFLLFDRKVGLGELDTVKPSRVWSFGPRDLPNYLTRSMIGWEYAMELRWDDDAPKSDTISLAARYTAPAGRRVYSSPVVIALGQR